MIFIHSLSIIHDHRYHWLVYRDSEVFNDIEKMDGRPASQEEQQHHKKSHAGKEISSLSFLVFLCLFVFLSFCLLSFCLFVFLSLHTSRSGGDKKHMWATVAGWLVGTTASATYSISLIVPGLLARHNDLLCYLDIRSGPRAANIPVLPSQTCFLILLLIYFIF